MHGRGESEGIPGWEVGRCVRVEEEPCATLSGEHCNVDIHNLEYSSFPLYNGGHVRG